MTWPVRPPPLWSLQQPQFGYDLYGSVSRVRDLFALDLGGFFAAGALPVPEFVDLGALPVPEFVPAP